MDETILSVGEELHDSTLHFELPEHTALTEQEELPATEEEPFELEWYSEEELDLLRKEFGILPDGSKIPFSTPSWDSSKPVRIIKTLAQKK